jgi:ribonucleoside-diphosphate reductase alpha chain
MDIAVQREATKQWADNLKIGEKNGWRNAQASVLAPTGTIGFMMDCDTTGIEPDFSLVKFKKLVGGGSLQVVNQTIPVSLRKLGYTEETVEAIVEYIAEHGHVIDAPGLKPEHYEVFDCAVGERAIKPMGHVRMMAAAQPFLSGAISKTVNMPESSTVEEIADIYYQGWKLGLKALAVYRDNCKVGQPLSDAKAKVKAKDVETVVVEKPIRKRMPRSRQSITTSFSVGGAEGYMTSGAHENGELGEIFLKLGKQGSTLAGVMDAFSIAISIALQYGVPLETFISKFTNMNFEPAGLTDDPDVRMSQSVMDYVFRRLALDYLDFDTRSALGVHTAEERQRYLDTGSHQPISSGTTAAELVEDGEAAESEAAAVAKEASVEAEDSVASRPEAGVRAAEQPEASQGASRTGDAVVESVETTAKPAPKGAHTSAELLEEITGSTIDSPLCMNCGTKMRPSGSCYVCEGCGSTSGCS